MKKKIALALMGVGFFGMNSANAALSCSPIDTNEYIAYCNDFERRNTSFDYRPTIFNLGAVDPTPGQGYPDFDGTVISTAYGGTGFTSGIAASIEQQDTVESIILNNDGPLATITVPPNPTIPGASYTITKGGNENNRGYYSDASGIGGNYSIGMIMTQTDGFTNGAGAATGFDNTGATNTFTDILAFTFNTKNAITGDFLPSLRIKLNYANAFLNVRGGGWTGFSPAQLKPANLLVQVHENWNGVVTKTNRGAGIGNYIDFASSFNSVIATCDSSIAGNCGNATPGTHVPVLTTPPFNAAPAAGTRIAEASMVKQYPVQWEEYDALIDLIGKIDTTNNPNGAVTVLIMMKSETDRANTAALGNIANRYGLIDNLRVSALIPPPMIRVAKTTTATNTTSGSVPYTITAENMAPTSAHNVVVTDTAQPGMTFGAWTCSVATGTVACPTMPASGNLNVTIANFPANSSLTFTTTATVPPGSTAANAVTATGPEVVCPGDLPAPCESATSVPSGPIVSVTKKPNTSFVSPGGTVEYTLSLRNIGDQVANGLVVSDPLPAGFSSSSWVCTAFNGATCPTASGSGNLNETIATLPVGGALDYTISSIVISPYSAALPASLRNVATVTPPTGGLIYVDDNTFVPGPGPANIISPPTTVNFNVAIPVFNFWGMLMLVLTLSAMGFVWTRRAGYRA